MAKKFVRGITDIKTINNQDLDTNNVNDLLSDGKHNYIHRKKNDGSEEYHNLTNNIKTIQSDDTDLLTVTNYNNTTNSATIRPKHDTQKEQLLESTDNTILINHGDNGTTQKTTVDVNPKKVLMHENLLSNSQYVTLSHAENSNTTVIKTDKLASKISELEEAVENGCVGQKPLVSPDKSINILEDTDKTAVTVNAHTLIQGLLEIFQVNDNQAHHERYYHDDAYLETVTKPLPFNSTDLYLLFKMNKGKTQATFELTPVDVQAFTYLMNELGLANKLDINGVEFTLNGQTLSVTTNNATNNQFVTSFSTVVYVENSGSGGGSVE